MYLKVSSAKWPLFCLGLNVLNMTSILMLLFYRLPVSPGSEVADALTDRQWQFVALKIDWVSLVRVCQGIKWPSTIDST